MEGRILVSEVPQNEPFDLTPWNIAHTEGARIVAILPGNEGEAVNLTEEFFSALTPSVSYDGEYMLFAGKKNASAHWQIWEMKLSTGKSRQLTFCDTDCTNPAYLPIDRFTFSKLVSNEKVKECNMLFTANLDGSNVQQITFSPQSFAALSVLKDGRVIAMEKQVYPEEGKQKMMVIRPDGTKLELFYLGAEGTYVQSRIVETENEEMLFVEKNDEVSNIVALSYNIPLHSYKTLTSDVDGEFFSVAKYKDEKLLVSYRKEQNNNFSLCEFDPVSGQIKEWHKSEGYNVLEAVVAEAYQRPKNLPSEVQLKEKAGLLMGQDINFYGIVSLHDTDVKKAQKIEILGIDSTLKVVDVEADGSFYIKIEADVPFRIQTLTGENEVVSGPGSWYYLRPNERRACVGCHTGPEVAPFNRQPLSVRKAPVKIKSNSELELNQKMKDYEH